MQITEVTLQHLYANISTLVLIVLLIEIIYSIYRKDGVYRFLTSISNISITIAIGFFVVFYKKIFDTPFLNSFTLDYFNNHFLISFIISFLLLEIIFYFVHRQMHTNKILWGIHKSHHTDTNLNLTTGGRANFLDVFIQYTCTIPLLFIGLPSTAILSAIALSSLLVFFAHSQYWLKHTVLDFFITTPSTHRMHHTIKYSNKNFANVFSFLDVMFGTFKAEPANEKLVYGTSDWKDTNNPIKISFGPMFEYFKSKIKRVN